VFYALDSEGGFYRGMPGWEGGQPTITWQDVKSVHHAGTPDPNRGAW
jgi:hypothetical protein